MKYSLSVCRYENRPLGERSYFGELQNNDCVTFWKKVTKTGIIFLTELRGGDTMNKTRPYRVYFRVSKEELDWLNEQVKQSGDTRQNYLLNKVVTPNVNDSDTDVEAISEEKKVCPKCGAALVVKDGRRGKFIGCSRWPNCNYSRDWSDDDAKYFNF